jgi:hypothetical protein
MGILHKQHEHPRRGADSMFNIMLEGPGFKGHRYAAGKADGMVSSGRHWV